MELESRTRPPPHHLTTSPTTSPHHLTDHLTDRREDREGASSVEPPSASAKNVEPPSAPATSVEPPSDSATSVEVNLDAAPKEAQFNLPLRVLRGRLTDPRIFVRRPRCISCPSKSQPREVLDRIPSKAEKRAMILYVWDATIAATRASKCRANDNFAHLITEQPA